MTSWVQTLLLWFGRLAVLAILGLGASCTYLLLPLLGIPIWIPGACITETDAKISDVAGLDFEISYVNCDVIAKQESMRILVSRSGGSSKTAIFEYSPASLELPTITTIDQHTILISLKSVSSILQRRDKWSGWTIVYAIGEVRHP